VLVEATRQVLMHFVIEDPVAFSFFSFRQAIVFSEFQQFAVEAEVLAVR
jgi:hypothetical protein